MDLAFSETQWRWLAIMLLWSWVERWRPEHKALWKARYRTFIKSWAQEDIEEPGTEPYEELRAEQDAGLRTEDRGEMGIEQLWRAAGVQDDYEELGSENEEELSSEHEELSTDQ